MNIGALKNNINNLNQAIANKKNSDLLAYSSKKNSFVVKSWWVNRSLTVVKNCCCFLNKFIPVFNSIIKSIHNRTVQQIAEGANKIQQIGVTIPNNKEFTVSQAKEVIAKYNEYCSKVSSIFINASITNPTTEVLAEQEKAVKYLENNFLNIDTQEYTKKLFIELFSDQINYLNIEESYNIAPIISLFKDSYLEPYIRTLYIVNYLNTCEFIDLQNQQDHNFLAKLVTEVINHGYELNQKNFNGILKELMIYSTTTKEYFPYTSFYNVFLNLLYANFINLEDFCKLNKHDECISYLLREIVNRAPQQSEEDIEAMLSILNFYSRNDYKYRTDALCLALKQNANNPNSHIAKIVECLMYDYTPSSHLGYYYSIIKTALEINDTELVEQLKTTIPDADFTIIQNSEPPTNLEKPSRQSVDTAEISKTLPINRLDNIKRLLNEADAVYELPAKYEDNITIKQSTPKKSLAKDKTIKNASVKRLKQTKDPTQDKLDIKYLTEIDERIKKIDSMISQN